MPETPTLVPVPVPSIDSEAGEVLGVLERVVVAPSRGVFTPLAPECVTTEGELVEAGQAIGTIESSGTNVDVLSPFTGFLMGMLAHDGERLREGEPVAWLRVVAA
jgi:biotin carboxyl carrier protein